ncbi:MAG: LemA family protein, partial [Gemmatimonadota bacterium]|nr:LemA family protein [Gemmatimonadota bacterium]
MTRRRLFTVFLAASATTTGCGYNRIQTLDEQVNQTQGQIEAQIQRRADLIPNLVNTVRGYAQHEEAVFGQIAQARSALLNSRSSGDPEQMANANAQFNSALGRLLVIAEAYPQLKADAQFRALQDQLEGTENRIATSRTDYNQAVGQYNGYIRAFPQALTAKVTGARPRKYFQVTNPTYRDQPPTVDFSRPGAGAGTAPGTPAAGTGAPRATPAPA